MKLTLAICALMALDFTSPLSIQDGIHQLIEGNFHELHPVPPPHTEPAKLARFIVHYSNWASMATLSSRNPKGFPFSNIFSISDGPNPKSATGTPYFYFTDMEMSVQDLQEDNRLSLSMTLDQGPFCKEQGLDTQDPPCPRVFLSGSSVKIAQGSEEEEFARNALFARHPQMADWPKEHEFYFAKMNVEEVKVLGYFGGATPVDLKEYYNTSLAY